MAGANWRWTSERIPATSMGSSSVVARRSTSFSTNHTLTNEAINAKSSKHSAKLAMSLRPMGRCLRVSIMVGTGFWQPVGHEDGAALQQRCGALHPSERAWHRQPSPLLFLRRMCAKSPWQRPVSGHECNDCTVYR